MHGFCCQLRYRFPNGLANCWLRVYPISVATTLSSRKGLVMRCCAHNYFIILPKVLQKVGCIYTPGLRLQLLIHPIVPVRITLRTTVVKEVCCKNYRSKIRNCGAYCLFLAAIHLERLPGRDQHILILGYADKSARNKSSEIEG